MGTAKSRAKPTVTTNVLELLASQHDEVDALFEKLEQGEGDRAAMFVELADKLAAHSSVEETIFYPGVMAAQTEELLHESVEDHLEVKRVLAQMITMKPDSDEFDAQLSVLMDKVSRHAHDEEEAKLFPIVRRMMTTDELAALGNEVLAMFEELLPRHPYKNVRYETSRPAPLPPVA